MCVCVCARVWVRACVREKTSLSGFAVWETTSSKAWQILGFIQCCQTHNKEAFNPRIQKWLGMLIYFSFTFVRCALLWLMSYSAFCYSECTLLCGRMKWPSVAKSHRPYGFTSLSVLCHCRFMCCIRNAWRYDLEKLCCEAFSVPILQINATTKNFGLFSCRC